MAKEQAGAGPQVFGFYLVPGFSMLSFTSAVEPLRAANRLAGRSLYGWHLITRTGAAVASSSSIEVLPHDGIETAGRLPNLIVVAGLDAHKDPDREVLAWLRRLERQGCRIGALSTGSYLLARAGLLNGYRSTIHWENLAGFQEEFRDLEVSSELYEIDRNRLTCSGGTAALDMMLSLIGLEHGRELATQVAEQFIHERIRDRHDKQRMGLRSRLGISHPKLLKIIALMEENLEEPLPRSELARQTGLSIRQMERLFRKYLSRTPTRYYLELRLYRARTLLAQTALSVLDVALACGFVSASHFSKCYREFFQKTPRDERLLSA
ncbi:MAG: GlxA family transcriptional regulator [Rhodospirillales bacterium]|nr:GlxA family transcriptional regulator [Rhodospirillales bacterium]MDH3791657.1 GlxA family transcriptional regulator [Rhodospirillales bacterium]MDH3911718.1 GlxA family transcriptional regulator [Rhodospirillales bacterium]MDH3919015.1 GlxA family transcriptional regulator [Rhodospirillales bacterium]MDH3967715.1 GlxA family transcriptional regulator [Rhodospirillales bacterium]